MTLPTWHLATVIILFGPDPLHNSNWLNRNPAPLHTQMEAVFCAESLRSATLNSLSPAANPKLTLDTGILHHRQQFNWITDYSIYSIISLILSIAVFIKALD